MHRTPHRFQNDIFFAWAKRGTIGSPSTGEYARWLESCSRSMAFQDFGAQRVPWQKDVIRHCGLWGWPPSAHLQQHRLMWRNLYRCLNSACTYARLHNLCGHLFISLDGGLAWICQLLEVSLKLLIAFIAALDFGNERVSTVSFPPMRWRIHRNPCSWTNPVHVRRSATWNHLERKDLRIWPGEGSKDPQV